MHTPRKNVLPPFAVVKRLSVDAKDGDDKGLLFSAEHAAVSVEMAKLFKGVEAVLGGGEGLFGASLAAKQVTWLSKRNVINAFLSVFFSGRYRTYLTGPRLRGFVTKLCDVCARLVEAGRGSANTREYVSKTVARVLRDGQEFDQHVRTLGVALFSLAKKHEQKLKYEMVYAFLEQDAGLSCKISEFCLSIMNLTFFVQSRV
jgi:hypothetical protein